jgi:hypothetical protein
VVLLFGHVSQMHDAFLLPGRARIEQFHDFSFVEQIASSKQCNVYDFRKGTVISKQGVNTAL